MMPKLRFEPVKAYEEITYGGIVRSGSRSLVRRTNHGQLQRSSQYGCHVEWGVGRILHIICKRLLLLGGRSERYRQRRASACRERV